MTDTAAIVLHGPKRIGIEHLALDTPGQHDLVVEISHSAISTGTEKLFWTGDMPPFPGMGYPLVPGYEAVGEVVETRSSLPFRTGDRVFVPGASCYGPVRGLFGAASRLLVTDADRALTLDKSMTEDGALLALAATARHAIAGPGKTVPDLIVGHGVLGRLLARLTIAAGAQPPVVWETNPDRRDGAAGYAVVAPDADDRRDYACIYDATGDAGILDPLIRRLRKGGEVVLAGFYAKLLQFAFPPAFMKEARIRVAAEWTRDDLVAVRALVESGALSLDGLISHRASARDPEKAYTTALENPACLKMVLDWRGTA